MADDKSKAEKAVDKDPEGVAAAGNEQVQEKVDDETERGYRGTTPDPTPNENYTVAGVTAGKPTPETDEKLAAEARRLSEGR
jgi:hypothetical protein